MDGNVDEQVGSVPDAVKAAEAGVDAIICQGFEAGGHIISRVRHHRLLAHSIHHKLVYFQI